ncbi:potassium channel interacting protein [Thecamonas trahens ATCC 50062]|uniref:Potassium channel interacting protein n=1 Tax=Thecamonas trahens ATCC 50062 TaxID=461836 RepID=A0A0L0D6J9_THETB|nr:potassium channel interacting protein [Thecamonas trahens ATCC 50062]KNC48007.1 potassium channel interacting protein [Thecamonas trahens ATCC 50062]|eukprot:XP_013759022.1 potassium channel interacting protein [Thecamonas trahens ATCC 50062]
MGKGQSKNAKASPSESKPKVTAPVAKDTKRALRKLNPKVAGDLVAETRLTKDEVSALHTYFQQLESLDGVDYSDGVTRETFIQHCLKVDLGHADAADRLFSLFDVDNSGSIDFRELCLFTSLMGRGSTTEKIRYAFAAFDLNSDGALDTDEVRGMLQASLKLAESLCIANREESEILAADSSAAEAITNDHVEEVFRDVDTNQNGTIELDEFLNAGTSNKYIKRVLDFFYMISHPAYVDAQRKKKAARAAAKAQAATVEPAAPAAVAASSSADPPANAASPADSDSDLDSSDCSDWSSFYSSSYE